MALDHGMLNLPLAKRGNIDAQIDAYKAKQAAEAKAARKLAAEEFKAQKIAAKAVLAALLTAPELLDQKAAAAKVSRKELIAAITSWSKWEPAKLLKAYRVWVPA
jgi:hypothetical protein